MRFIGWFAFAVLSVASLFLVWFLVLDLAATRWINLPLDLIFLAICLGVAYVLYSWLHPR